MNDEYAWHKFSLNEDVADCGFVPTKAWVYAEPEEPTVRNTCPLCLRGREKER
jgi:hypothetical protein